MFCFLQTFLRVRANRHTRLNGKRSKSCVWLPSSQFVANREYVTCSLLNGLKFKRLEEWEFSLFTLMRPVMCFSPPQRPPFASCADISSFSHTISTGLAPTRAEELLTSQLWPLDMLTVDDLCWCRCYVKSGPLRPHSAGAHLDCTQAGKKHWETLFSFRVIMFICQVLNVGFDKGSERKHLNNDI